MAEFDGLDGRLRDALGRAAEPGDPAGVADAIRARVAAGDSGASVAASTAPGWGGGVLRWLPWLGMLVAGALVGSAIGVSGLAGRPAGEVVVDVPSTIGESAPASSCVDGPVIGRIAAGTRVLAVSRDETSTWVGVRDPGALGSTVWVRLGDVALDAGTPALAELPVGGACPEVVVAIPVEPEPEPAPTQEPGPAPQPRDTTPPQILQFGAANMNCQTSQQISVVASDNVGVTGVSLSWTGVVPGSANMAPVGSEWRYSFTAPSHDAYYDVTFTAVARDAAGNTRSASTTITVACIG